MGKKIIPLPLPPSKVKKRSPSIIPNEKPLNNAQVQKRDATGREFQIKRRGKMDWRPSRFPLENEGMTGMGLVFHLGGNFPEGHFL